MNLRKLLNNKYCLFILLLVIICFKSYALPEDRNKIANLSADNADINQTMHEGKYFGHVIFDQGTTHLRAAIAITQMDDNSKLIYACAYGNKELPVHYWEEIEASKPILHAYAKIIRYYPNSHLIELIGDAHVNQGKDSFSAPIIRYNTEKKQVIGRANPKFPVKIIIHPEKKA